MQGTCPALHRSRTVVLRGSGSGHVTPQLDKKTAKNLAFRPKLWYNAALHGGWPSKPARRQKQMSERSGDPDSSGQNHSNNHTVLFTIPPYGHGPGAPGCPDYAKRTQSPHVSDFSPCNYAKRTQFTIPPHDQNVERSEIRRGGPNKPNPHPFRACHAGRRSVPMHIGEPNSPNYTKRTQSTAPPHPKTRQTNPISAPVVIPSGSPDSSGERSAAAQSRGIHSITIAEGDSKQKNEPNSPPQPPHPRPKNPKQTQFLAWRTRY